MTKWLMVFCCAASLCGQGQNVNGNWTGAITLAGRTLNFRVHLDANSGTWESVDQSATAPVKSVQVKGRAVEVGLGVASFEGQLDTAGEKIEGSFKQGTIAVPLTLKRFTGKFVAARRPQDPVPPYPYASEDVTIVSAGDIKLAGTLTMPKAGGPFPGVLLISGSGAQDRDEALLGHRPFLVLSDYLTRAGFAVLRLDDRGTGKSSGVFATTSYADKVADVLAAVRYVKGRKDVDAARIGLIGHSEGASIGPMAAAESRDIAYVVMLAGIGVKGADVLKQQGIDSTRAAGGTEAQVASQVEIQAKLLAIYREAKSPEAAREQARQFLGAGPRAEGQIQMMESATIRDLLAFDPAPVLRKLSVPVLAMNGSLDVQVSAKQNLPAIASALAASASKDWQVTALSGLNHLFQSAKTGGFAEYAEIQETIAPLALRTLNAWLTERFLIQK